jgi:23S rRNA A1618 N6-methylase RlmF
MDKENVIYNGVLVSHKEKQVMSCRKVNELEIITLNKISQAQKESKFLVWNLVMKRKDMKMEGGLFGMRMGSMGVWKREEKVMGGS